MKKAIILTLIILSLLSCVSTRSIRYETQYRDPKPDTYEMEIFDSNDLKKPYKVIGIVQANAGKLHSQNDTIEHLKKEACKMGGDALIDFQFGPSNSGVVAPVGDNYVYGNAREIWSAKVIVWETIE